MNRLAEALWNRGVDVSLKQLRRWALPVERIEEWADALQVAWEREGRKGWAPIVLLNQLQIIFETEEGALRFLSYLIDENRPIIPTIIAWRAERLEPETLLAKPIDRPKYLDGVKGIADFFMAVYKYEYGLDVDEIVENIRSALGGERYVEDFLRLVDVDLPLEPEMFVRRVEEAVNVVLKAREQGLDVGRIMEEWDRLAESGGERLDKLADAVRIVAEEEVRRKFWEEVRKAFEENGVHVFPDQPIDDLMEKAYYEELIDVKEGNVELTGLKDIISRLSPLLKSIRPIPMFRTREIESALLRVGIGRADPDTVLSLLQKMPRRALRTYFGTPLWQHILEGIRRKAKDPGIEERLAKLLKEIEMGNIEKGEDVLRILLPD